MFLKKTLERNKPLVLTAIELHQKGIIYPDTYVLDLDTILDNAKKMLNEAKKNNIELFFMTKQIGRNPYISKKLMELGFFGAVAVDFKEALVMARNNIKIGNVGHLVQIPKHHIEEIVSAKPEYITVYSIEKAKEISDVCKKLGIIQKLMLRVYNHNDILYHGQYGGFKIENLLECANKISSLPNVEVKALTAFPCFLYNETAKKTLKTPNLHTIVKGKEVLEKHNFKNIKLNMPSATSCETIEHIAKFGGHIGEPGHALTGTMPFNSENDGLEIPAIVYLSEISHNVSDKCYCYGGGHYRRSNVSSALVASSVNNFDIYDVVNPDKESIDYHFEISGNSTVSNSVIMAFRTQIFVTRSNVVIVEGISKDKPNIVGHYTALGELIDG